MKKLVKHSAKFLIITCAAAGVVALVASGAAAGAVAAGFKSAKNIMAKTFAEKKWEEVEKVEKNLEVYDEEK